MNKKLGHVSMLALLISLLAILEVPAIPLVHAFDIVGIIFIRPEGAIEPSTAPILRNQDTYTFTDDIFGSIVIERDNVTIEGVTHTLHGNGVGTGISLSNRSNVTIHEISVIGFQRGINLNYSSDINVIANNFSNNTIGALATWAINNTFRYNTITNNSDCGILLDNNSQENSIASNEIANNNRGIYISNSSSNTIARNNILNNTVGILFGDTTGNVIYQNNFVSNTLGLSLTASSLPNMNNTIYHNNFVENKLQTQIGTKTPHNTWDDGYPSGGNYWSNYNGTDTHNGQFQNATGGPDRIGDTPYVVGPDNYDRYPLIYPYGFFPSPDLNGDGEVDIADIAEAALAFGSQPGGPLWDFKADLSQDGVVDVLDLAIIAKAFGESALIQNVSIATDKPEYVHLETVRITVNYCTRTTVFRNVVLSANIEDELNVSFGIEMTNVTVGGAVLNQLKQYTSRLNMTIPYWAAAGQAVVHVNFLEKLQDTQYYRSIAEATLNVEILAA